MAPTLLCTHIHTAALYGVTLFGAITMYAFSMHKGFAGTVEFLKKAIPDRSPVFYVRLDALFVCVAGSFIGWIIYSPQTSFQALAAGFGWVGAMRVLAGRTDKTVAEDAKAGE
jgi:hypothetical protein